MKKRILGLALVAILVLNLLPMCVSAATAGYCGKNATWTFNEKTGVLVISGTGAMDDYDYSVGSIPWYVLGKNIKSIIVNNGITHIGNEAFWSSAVESVTLPSSLESIGWGAFENCDKLKKVIIPEGVKKIEECTFRSCRSLETVIIPNSVTKIEEKAFEHSGITNIIIPDSVTSIGQYAFGSCKKLKSLVLPDNVQLGVNVFSDSTMLEVKSDKIQTVYAADGRHANVKKTEVAYYLEQGWYLEPVQTLYAIGKSALFKKSEVEAQLTVGWYEEPVVYMYAMDGRRRVTKKSEIEAYEKVNWYYGKPVKMYALDGRTKWVGENRVKENEKVNWYYGKPTKMYAPDGRVITIGENRVEEYKKVGWYTDKATADKYKVDYYPGTKFKTYTYVIGKKPFEIEAKSGGRTMYRYDHMGQASDKYLEFLETYLKTLRNDGATYLENYSGVNSDNSGYTYWFTKNGQDIVILANANGLISILCD